jgi:HK97 family phage major capsid protein
MKLSTILAQKIEEMKGKIQLAENIEEVNTINASIELETAKMTAAIESEAAAQAEPAKPVATTVIPGVVESKNENKIYENAFYNALAGRADATEIALLDSKAALSSTTGEDGGYLIPIDQRTAIKELMREYGPLDQYVNVEVVSTLTGSRNLEVNAEHVPFVKFVEGDTIAEIETPKFVNLTFSIDDRGGILTIPNDLLADNTAGLMAYLNKWLAKKIVATRNALILEILATLTKTAMTDYKDIKTTLNVLLDPAISQRSIIFTNQDGFNFLDQAEDGNGRPLLQPDPTSPTSKMFAGRKIVSISNVILKSTGTVAPVIVGDLKQVITLFDRQMTSIVSTKTGAGSFEKNQTKVRAITREDGKIVDTGAVVYRTLETAPVA